MNPARSGELSAAGLAASGEAEEYRADEYLGLQLFQNGVGELLVVCSNPDLKAAVEHELAGTEPPAGIESPFPKIKPYATAPGVTGVEVVWRADKFFWDRLWRRQKAAKPPRVAPVVASDVAPARPRVREHRRTRGSGCKARAPADRPDDPEPPPLARRRRP